MSVIWFYSRFILFLISLRSNVLVYYYLITSWSRWCFPQSISSAKSHCYQWITMPKSKGCLFPVNTNSVQFSSVQSLSRVQLFVSLWITERQASLFITNSQSPLKLMSVESVMPSNHLVLCRPLLLLSPIPPSIRIFSNDSTFRIRWPKYWSFSFSIIPSIEQPGLISFRMDWLDLLAVQILSRVFSNTTVQKHQFFGAQPSSQSNSHIHTWPQEKP